MGFNLLIVDDSRSMRSVIRKVVEMSGAAVEEYFEAENGAMALKILDQQRIDLILSDINMPVMDGLELLARLVEDEAYASIPLIIVSTEGSQERKEEAAKLGAAGYLQKPFQPEAVRGLLERCLKERS